MNVLPEHLRKPWPDEILPSCRPVGYWYSRSQPELPVPCSTDLEPDTDLVNYLHRGRIHTPWMGFSTCRICGVQNGTECLTDGVWQWPSGLAHYVRDHGVQLDEEFVTHVKTVLWDQLFGDGNG